MRAESLWDVDPPSLFFHGDRAHIIARPDTWTGKRLIKELARQGIVTQSIETVESTLEDVFTLLAHSGGVNV